MLFPSSGYCPEGLPAPSGTHNNNTQIQFTQDHTFLGVKLDTLLSFRDHVAGIRDNTRCALEVESYRINCLEQLRTILVCL